MRKIKRLQIWCSDVDTAQNERRYAPLYVKQEMWEKHKKDIRSFKDVIKIFPSPHKQIYIGKNISLKGDNKYGKKRKPERIFIKRN
ncbi:DUF2129 domain-containing protein [candidate division KSB1 bacterium]|nr:DUF2129 domain-containing protein [candidate division KSB1 bacterium]